MRSYRTRSSMCSTPDTCSPGALRGGVGQRGARRAPRAEFLGVFFSRVPPPLGGALFFFSPRLQAQAQALRPSEKHSRAITETASEAIISTDEIWTIVS